MIDTFPGTTMQIFERNLLYFIVIFGVFKLVVRNTFLSSFMIQIKSYHQFLPLRFSVFDYFHKYIKILRCIREKSFFGWVQSQISIYYSILSVFYHLIMYLSISKQRNNLAKKTVFSFRHIKFVILISIILLSLDRFDKQSKLKVNNQGKKQSFRFINITITNRNNIIWNVGTGCEKENITQGRSFFNISIDISHCFFSRSLTFSGNGGVVYISGGSYSLSFNNSMFYNCVCSQNGGAIHFSSSNSFLRMICAKKCSCGSSYSYHFAYLGSSHFTQVDYLSVSNNYHPISGNLPICIELGNQSIDHTNCSMNNARQCSGIGTYYPLSQTISYSTFSNNNVTQYSCIFIYSETGILTMSYVNIVHNNSPTFGIIYANGAGSRKMMHCIFHNNQNYLFCVRGGSLEVSHAFVDHSSTSFSSATSVLTETNNSFVHRITYQLQFFDSHHCNADIPLPERTLVQSQMRSLEETLCMTFDMTADQTISETLKETIHRSYVECIFTNQMNNKREIKVIFSFFCLSNIQ